MTSLALNVFLRSLGDIFRRKKEQNIPRRLLSLKSQERRGLHDFHSVVYFSSNYTFQI